MTSQISARPKTRIVWRVAAYLYWLIAAVILACVLWMQGSVSGQPSSDWVTHTSALAAVLFGLAAATATFGAVVYRTPNFWTVVASGLAVLAAISFILTFERFNFTQYLIAAFLLAGSVVVEFKRPH